MDADEFADTVAGIANSDETRHRSEELCRMVISYFADNNMSPAQALVALGVLYANIIHTFPAESRDICMGLHESVVKATLDNEENPIKAN